MQEFDCSDLEDNLKCTGPSEARKLLLEIRNEKNLANFKKSFVTFSSAMKEYSKGNHHPIDQFLQELEKGFVQYDTDLVLRRLNKLINKSKTKPVDESKDLMKRAEYLFDSIKCAKTLGLLKSSHQSLSLRLEEYDDIKCLKEDIMDCSWQVQLRYSEYIDLTSQLGINEYKQYEILQKSNKPQSLELLMGSFEKLDKVANSKIFQDKADTFLHLSMISYELGNYEDALEKIYLTRYYSCFDIDAAKADELTGKLRKMFSGEKKEIKFLLEDYDKRLAAIDILQNNDDRFDELSLLEDELNYHHAKFDDLMEIQSYRAKFYNILSMYHLGQDDFIKAKAFFEKSIDCADSVLDGTLGEDEGDLALDAREVYSKKDEYFTDLACYYKGESSYRLFNLMLDNDIDPVDYLMESYYNDAIINLGYLIDNPTILSEDFEYLSCYMVMDTYFEKEEYSGALKYASKFLQISEEIKESVIEGDFKATISEEEWNIKYDDALHVAIDSSRNLLDSAIESSELGLIMDYSCILLDKLEKFEELGMQFDEREQMRAQALCHFSENILPCDSKVNYDYDLKKIKNSKSGIDIALMKEVYNISMHKTDLASKSTDFTIFIP